MNEELDESIKTVAAEELKKVLLLANKMTIVDSDRRKILFELTKAPVTKLLELGDRTSEQSVAIRENIASLARALLDLRNLGDGQIEAIPQDEVIDCPHCLTMLTRMTVDSSEKELDRDRVENESIERQNEKQWFVFCRPCSAEYTLAFEQLCLEVGGFGVDSLMST